MVAQMSTIALRHATDMHSAVVDVVISDGIISGVGSEGTNADGAVEVDLTGFVLLPAAVEPHAHLDKAFLAGRFENKTGDLKGAIEAMQANRHLINTAETIERAERAARLMAANGYSAVRTHADTIGEHGLRSIEALTEVRRRVSDIIDIEIVALCGWPVSGKAGAEHRALLRAALAAGADLVGGCPHLEDDSEAATDALLQIAIDTRRAVDLHTDETLDPRANGLLLLAQRVLAGFDLPVTASHCVSLGQQPIGQQHATAELVAAAGIHIVTLPHTNLYLQGRGHSRMPRGLTSISLLRQAGVTVAAGGDNLQDLFNPLGRGCPFDTAALMVLAAHDLPSLAWESVSTESAKVLGRSVLGIRAGAPADLVAVRADTVREAIAFGAPERIVWRAGVRVTGHE